MRLRRRGHLGGAILPHRSIWRLNLPLRRLLLGSTLALGYTLLLALVQDVVAEGWINAVLWWLQSLGVPGQYGGGVGMDGPFLLAQPVPLLLPDLPETHLGQLGWHALVLLLLWVGSAYLPDAARPLGYLVRFGVLMHACTLVFFAGWHEVFPHTVYSHVAANLRQSWLLMLLTPWLHLATFYVFPFGVWRQAALTGLTLLWLLLFSPLQYALHAALLAQTGLVLMPLLHVLFGVVLSILGMVALYGWAMGWQDPAELAEAAELA